MLLAWSLTVLLVGIIALMQQYTLGNLSDELVLGETQMLDSQGTLNQLIIQSRQHKASVLLTEKREQLKHELRGKRVLSEYLKGQEVAQTHRYSTVMEDMARLHGNKLWISEMRFDPLGMWVKGYALNAVAVPQWLDNLQQSPFFVGKEFAVFNLEDEDDKVIAFEINSRSHELQALQAQLDAAGDNR